jgi:hypothetical protein
MALSSDSARLSVEGSDGPNAGQKIHWSSWEFSEIVAELNAISKGAGGQKLDNMSQIVHMVLIAVK